MNTRAKHKQRRQFMGRNGTLKDGRRREHINRGGRAFMPQSRMNHIRHEEAVANSRAKREGREGAMMHFDCSCGSIECLANPLIRPLSPAPKPAPKEPQLTEAEYFAARYGSVS